MKIVILPRPEGNVVAREYQGRHPEGWFVLENDGKVYFTSPFASSRSFVNNSLEQFRVAVQAYDEYADTAAIDEQAVPTLLQRVRAIDHYPDAESDFWPLILEQVEDGLL